MCELVNKWPKCVIDHEWHQIQFSAFDYLRLQNEDKVCGPWDALLFLIIKSMDQLNASCEILFVWLLVQMNAGRDKSRGFQTAILLWLWIHLNISSLSLAISSRWYCLYALTSVTYHTACMWVLMLGKLTLGVVAWGHMLRLLERERGREKARGRWIEWINQQMSLWISQW